MPLSAHEFERRLIFYASPTLTKLKVACIYNLNDLDDLEECIQYYNELLNKKDIYLKVLKIKGRSMIYVYQKEKLNKLCACKQIQNIFKKYNYNCTSLDTLILDLQKRLNDYDFLHEIGLFLGYPMTDVLGFIEGKEYLSVGYWKVYSHVKNCQHTFDKYHKCTHELCKRFNQGESVEQICRYV